MANALHTPGVVDAKAARLDDGGLLALQGPGPLDVRTGVLHGPGTTALVTGTSSTSPMRYSIAAHHWVTSRSAASGPYRGALEATQLVDTTPAPGSGSRIDVIWVKQQDNTAGIPTPDGVAAEQYGVTQGTATTGTPTKPTIPVGALELATATVAAGATATNGSGVVITNTVLQTVARGAAVPVRNQAERTALEQAWGSKGGLTVKRLDVTGFPMEEWDGTIWRRYVLAEDTGWVDIPIAQGFAATADSVGKPQLRRINGIVYVRGGWASTGLSANGTFTVGTLPDGFRPPITLRLKAGTAATNGQGQFSLWNGGPVQLSVDTTVQSGYFLGAGLSWPAA